jgi:hypothetical protein
MRKLLISIMIIFTIALGATMNSCDQNILNPGDHIAFPESNVSYQNHVEAFIRVQCSYAGCHNMLNQNGVYDLIGYANWYLNYTLLFVTEDPNASRFYQIVSMDARYPTHYPVFPINQFTDNEVEGIKTWILEGIPNN